MPSSPLSVAVIGANGFVGRALCTLMETRPDIRVQRLGRPDFDLTEQGTWSTLAPGTECVVHAAALTGGDLYRLFDVNALSAGPLARHLNELGVRKLIFLSTGAVYGANPAPTTPDTPCAPVTPYAISKYLAERKLAERFLGRLNVLRLYYPYGPRQGAERLFPRLKARIANGETVTVNEDGGPRLSVTHVDDLCSVMIERFILSDEDRTIHNLASDQILRVAEAARAIAALMGRSVSFSHNGVSPDCVSEPYRPASWRPFVARDVLSVGDVHE